MPRKILTTAVVIALSSFPAASPSRAAISAAGGGAVVGAACFPTSIVWTDPASPSSDTAVFGFNEQTNILLPGGTPVDILVVPGDYEDPGDLTPGLLPDGCYVDVDYIHYLPANPPAAAEARFTFAHPIIGVVVEDATHDATNFLGCPATDYGTCLGSYCGMELQTADRIRVRNQSVRVDLDALEYGDRVRVITLRDPTGECNSLVEDD